MPHRRHVLAPRDVGNEKLTEGTKQPKATKPTVRVLEALLERPTEERHGFDLLEETELRSGTLYPILIRFERLGWLTSSWEESDRQGPRRRLYRLTAEGEPAARRLVAKAKKDKSLGRMHTPFPAGGGLS
jgi:PadR family transcriptional regulator, regulatory protein PadR